MDAAIALYGTIHRTERVWSQKVSAGEWHWNDGHDAEVAHLYRDWHEAAGEVIAHLDSLERRNVVVPSADVLRESYGTVAALMDIGLDRVFQRPAPPQSGKPLREIRDGLQR
ncbi:MAG TPA: hypothetical protein VGR35_20775 [Tepidisphaeraceae bacterium]|nr:hypothetical protein [Tepidisphaeraceae bacterium]